MRVPTSRAVASRLRSLRSMPLYWFFPAVGRVRVARRGVAPAVGLAAPRRPRRHPGQLQLHVRCLRQLDASWLACLLSSLNYCGSMASSATWSTCRAKVPGQDAFGAAIQGRGRVLQPRPRAAALRRARPPRRREGLF